MDLQGRKPSLGSILRIPKTLWTWWASRRQKLLARPYPFLVWDAIHRLDELLQPGQRVLEVAGGNSTLWLLERGVEVHTIEPEAEWIRAIETEVARRFPPDVQARWTHTHRTGKEAVRSIEALDEASLDMVIVDPQGQQIPRLEALLAAKSKLRPGGWLVLDNSDHPQQWEAVDVFGPPDHVVTGYGAMCLVVTQTAFWQWNA